MDKQGEELASLFRNYIPLFENKEEILKEIITSIMIDTVPFNFKIALLKRLMTKLDDETEWKQNDIRKYLQPVENKEEVLWEIIVSIMLDTISFDFKIVLLKELTTKLDDETEIEWDRKDVSKYLQREGLPLEEFLERKFQK